MRNLILTSLCSLFTLLIPTNAHALCSVPGEYIVSQQTGSDILDGDRRVSVELAYRDFNTYISSTPLPAQETTRRFFGCMEGGGTQLQCARDNCAGGDQKCINSLNVVGGHFCAMYQFIDAPGSTADFQSQLRDKMRSLANAAILRAGEAETAAPREASTASGRSAQRRGRSSNTRSRPTARSEVQGDLLPLIARDGDLVYRDPELNAIGCSENPNVVTACFPTEGNSALSNAALEIARSVATATLPGAAGQSANSIDLPVEGEVNQALLKEILRSEIRALSESPVFSSLPQETLNQTLSGLESACRLPGLRSEITQEIGLLQVQRTKIAQGDQASEEASKLAERAAAAEQIAPELRRLDSEIAALSAQIGSEDSEDYPLSKALTDYYNSSGILSNLPCHTAMNFILREMGASLENRARNPMCMVKKSDGASDLSVVPVRTEETSWSITSLVTRSPETVLREVTNRPRTVSCNWNARTQMECSNSCSIREIRNSVQNENVSDNNHALTPAERLAACQPRDPESRSGTPFYNSIENPTTAGSCTQLFELLAEKQAQRATILAAMPEVGTKDESGQPLYRRLQTSDQPAQAYRQALATNAAQELLGEGGLRGRIQSICENPNSAIKHALENPSRLRSLLSCGDDPIQRSDSCNFLRGNAQRACALSRMARFQNRDGSDIGATFENALTFLDVAECVSLPLVVTSGAAAASTGLRLLARRAGESSARWALRVAGSSGVRSLAGQATFGAVAGYTVGTGMSLLALPELEENLADARRACLTQQDPNACSSIPDLLTAVRRMRELTPERLAMMGAMGAVIVPNIGRTRPVKARIEAIEADLIDVGRRLRDLPENSPDRNRLIRQRERLLSELGDQQEALRQQWLAQGSPDDVFEVNGVSKKRSEFSPEEILAFHEAAEGRERALARGMSEARDVAQSATREGSSSPARVAGSGGPYRQPSTPELQRARTAAGLEPDSPGSESFNTTFSEASERLTSRGIPADELTSRIRTLSESPLEERQLRLARNAAIPMEGGKIKDPSDLALMAEIETLRSRYIRQRSGGAPDTAAARRAANEFDDMTRRASASCTAGGARSAR